MATSLRTCKLICIAGLANAGKDTATHMLHYLLNAPKMFRTYGWYKLLKKWPFKNKWKITSFAKPLKRTLAVILVKPVEWFDDRKNKEKYYVDLNTLNVYSKYELRDDLRLSENKFQKLIKSGEPLPLDQYISIRQLMQYYGTECVRKYLGDKTWINSTLNTIKDNTIISDLRFRVELEEVKKKNGKIIYISRSSSKPGSHASEREVVELFNERRFDYVVPNEGTLKELFNNLKTLI